MLEDRRHAPMGRRRTPRAGSQQGSTALYRRSSSRALRHIYDADHAETRHTHRFRWLISTCLAAGVGGIAIGIAILGSIVPGDQNAPILASVSDALEGGKTGELILKPEDGLAWAVARTDKLRIVSGARVTKDIIQERVEVKRDNRPFMQIKPYIRVLAKLTAVPKANADVIPPFNPVELTNTPDPQDGDGGTLAAGASTGEIIVAIAEVLGGVLPIEDQQELDAGEVATLVQASEEEEDQQTALRPGFLPEAAEVPTLTDAGAPTPGPVAIAPGPNTTVVKKRAPRAPAGGIPGSQTFTRVIAAPTTIAALMQELGAEPQAATAMSAVAQSSVPDGLLQALNKVNVTLQPSLTKTGAWEPVAFSIYSERGQHRVSVRWDEAVGTFAASKTPPPEADVRTGSEEADDGLATSTVYASLYNATLVQKVQTDSILKILRILAPGTDLSHRIQPGDQAEFFFDVDKDQGIDSTPGELLYTAVTLGGELQRFWRFRTGDGIVDYYDAAGNNSRKFLLRRPVSGDNVRFTSGFGMRFHPVLRFARPHNGIDWATGGVGSPILAAGNGVIEFIGRRGEFGNHIRIQHANNYMTSYSHMVKFAAGMAEGVKVKQNQVIGYLGATGLVSGPHLHFEVHVNNRPVDPLKIQVGQERQLKGKQLSDFLRERIRIDELMRRSPVLTASR